MTEADFQQFADELAVRRVLEEYCLRLEVNQFDHWMDLFTEDTEYVVFRQTLRGRQEVSAMLSQAPHGVHLGGAARIQINGDIAETIQNYMFIPTSTDQWNVGWYQRSLKRTPDGWKIAHTQVKIARTGEFEPNEKSKKLAFPISF